MKVAVLACGPSLPRHYNRDQAFDVVIAVNTAGWLYPCDWLAFSDRHIIEPIINGELPPACIGLLSNTGWRGTAHAHGLKWAPLPIYDHRLGNLTPAMHALAQSQNMTECGYTFPNALYFASCIAAAPNDEVHVYGFDCAQQADDVAGVKGYHAAARWLIELPWIRAVWRANFVPHCEAHPDVLAYVAGKGDPATLQAIFRQPC